MTDIFDETEVVSFTDAPSEDESKSLAQLGQELFETDTRISELNAALESAQKRKQELVRKVLPDYMVKVGQNKIGLEGFGVDLVLEDFYHANIAADWEPERREAAFDWLEKSGNGDLLKTTVALVFPRRALGAARWAQAAMHTLVSYLHAAGAEAPDLPEATVDMGVPWNTLTAFCREQIENGNELPLDTLGVTVGKVVKIKKQKGLKK